MRLQGRPQAHIETLVGLTQFAVMATIVVVILRPELVRSGLGGISLPLILLLGAVNVLTLLALRTGRKRWNWLGRSEPLHLTPAIAMSLTVTVVSAAATSLSFGEAVFTGYMHIVWFMPPMVACSWLAVTLFIMNREGRS